MALVGTSRMNSRTWTCCRNRRRSAFVSKAGRAQTPPSTRRVTARCTAARPCTGPVFGIVAVKVCFSGPCGFDPAELKASCACSDKRPTDDVRAVTTVVWRAFEPKAIRLACPFCGAASGVKRSGLYRKDAGVCTCGPRAAVLPTLALLKSGVARPSRCCRFGQRGEKFREIATSIRSSAASRAGDAQRGLEWLREGMVGSCLIALVDHRHRWTPVI